MKEIIIIQAIRKGWVVMKIYENNISQVVKLQTLSPFTYQVH